jgi:hypothetical protein
MKSLAECARKGVQPQKIVVGNLEIAYPGLSDLLLIEFSKAFLLTYEHDKTKMFWTYGFDKY